MCESVKHSHAKYNYILLALSCPLQIYLHKPFHRLTTRLAKPLIKMYTLFKIHTINTLYYVCKIRHQSNTALFDAVSSSLLDDERKPQLTFCWGNWTQSCRASPFLLRSPGYGTVFHHQTIMYLFTYNPEF